jgi:molybdopterin-binding protein
MSFFYAMVSNIEACESLHIVHFTCEGQELSMMSLELSSKVRVGSKVKLVIKPMHISLVIPPLLAHISDENQIRVEVSSCTHGKLLSHIDLVCGSVKMESVITATSAKKMELKVGQKLIALMKSSDLAIGEVL